MEASSVEFADFEWVEEVRGPLRFRDNRVVRIADGPPPPCEVELYRSAYVSDRRLSAYYSTNKGTENPSGIRGFRGPCTILHVPFDIDREIEQDGDKQPDWDTAIRDARQFLRALELLYEIDLGMVRCCLTGGRGVHLYLPAAFFGGFEPSTAVPKLVAAIAESLADEAGIRIDCGIYQRNHLIRVPNSRHPSGKYCVPLYAAELANLDVDRLLALMNCPRPDVTWVGELEPADSLVALKQERGKWLTEKTGTPREFKAIPPERANEILAFLGERGIDYQTQADDYVLRCPTGKHADNIPSFRIHRQSGVFHCFGCGVRGNWQKCQRLLSARLPDEAGEHEYEKVAEEIYTARQKSGNLDRRKDFEINKEVTSKILAHLKTVGRFHTDGHKAYFFFQAEKRLIEISAEDDGFRLLLHRYGINPTEALYRWIVEALRNEALARGQRTEIHRLAYYDPLRFTVYLHNLQNQIYRIGGDQIDLVDNGSDGVLFLSDPKAKPFERGEVSGAPSRLTEVITSKINFADDALTPGERQRVFELWFYSMFFENIMPTKPIVAFIGPKGSGKSITLRKVGLLLFGERFDVTPLTNDSKDFDAAVTNSPFVAFDNADHKCAWLNDRLATVATGGAIKKRELYTTNRLIEIPTRCFVGITAHTPHFRRDDVADRLLIMKVERFQSFISERSLLAEVMTNREEILSEVILKLQTIVRALRAEHGVDDSCAFRMADFADFAMKVARQEGWGEQLKRIFGKLGHEQSEFTLEGDPIFETLSIWAPDHPEQEVTYKKLWAELKKVAENEGIDFQEYANNARGFARRMPNIRSNLEEFFDITDVRRGGHRVVHMFRPKEGE